MIRDGKDRRGLHTTTFAETDWPQKHYFYYWITFAMGDGRVPGPKRTKVAHVLVVTVKSWLTRLIIISTAKSLMVVFLIFKTKKKKIELYARLQNWRWPRQWAWKLSFQTVRHAVHDVTFQRSIVIISYMHETYLGTLTTSNLCTIFSATIVRHCIENKTTVNLRRSNLGIWR